MKICRDCGAELPDEEFYVHAEMRDGRLNKCKDCVKERVMKHRAANIEAVLSYDRGRSMLPHRVSARAKYAKTERGRLAISRSNRAYYKRNSVKRKAHDAVLSALRNGRLERMGCEVCGVPRANAHHDNYSKPLEVRWLCPAHHREFHKQAG